MRATDEGLIYEMLCMVGEIPAGRVVNHAGRTALGWRLQAELLHAGGVEFRENGCVDMKWYQWEC